MTGNGIESDFVLPDSLFISDYSTLPSFYPHFGANCRFFCTISMSPDSSTLFCSPNAARGAASGLCQRVFDPLDSRSRDSVERIFILCPRVDWGETQGALPLDPAKGSSTLWTPFRAIQLVTFSYCFRVFIGEPEGRMKRDEVPTLTPFRDSKPAYSPPRSFFFSLRTVISSRYWNSFVLP